MARWELNATRHPIINDLPVRRSTPNYFCWLFLHNLMQLRALVTPRVQSACFSTAWNRWTTAARFQQRETCLLCRRIGSEDRIEHYSRCERVQDFGRRFLRLAGPHSYGIHTFTLTNPKIITTEQLTTSAILIYAVYNLTNRLRHDIRDLPEEEIYNALSQLAREAVHGHKRSSSTLRQLWTTSNTTPTTPLGPEPYGGTTNTTASRPRSSYSLPQSQPHCQPQFQSGGFLNTTTHSGR